MPTRYVRCAQETGRLHRALCVLESTCESLDVAGLAGREWFELLTRKLLPQLSDDAFLVVAVVGGTNIGKSVVFNHLAGCRASATSPLASGTKHPVCLVPEHFEESHDLKGIFGGFQLVSWSTADAALEECVDDQLYWRTSADMPPNLLILDTPDIDSDARVNWARADHIRRCADVLIAVLTQQKYNDAAVKQFFRKAAEEGKAVIVVFNQCLLPEDEAYWPVWLKTFCDETNVEPEFVYLAPNDRAAAENNQLGFYERLPRVNAADSNTACSDTAESMSAKRNLSADLSRLRFAEIKIRTLQGSFDLLQGPSGVPAYLHEVCNKSDEFRAAAELMGSHKLVEIDNWPAMPNSRLVTEIRQWWNSQREGWSKRIHGFYNGLGKGVLWPFRYVHHCFVGDPVPLAERYRREEWAAILGAVERIYERLQWFSELGNELLRPRLEKLLSGTTRSQLLTRLEEEHARVDFDRELHQLVYSEMATFQDDSPALYQFLKRLDGAAAAVRPATSIVLFAVGLGPVGDAAAQLAAHSAVHSAVQVAGDVAAGTAVATLGETALSSTASASAGYVESKFRRIHSIFTAKRIEWVVQMLKKYLLGDLPDELQMAADLPQSAAFHDVQTAMESLNRHLNESVRQETTSRNHE